MLFDSCKNAVFGKILVFGNIFAFPGINWVQNGPNHHFWICLISALTLNFERLFRGCLFFIRLLLVRISANSSHIWGRKGPGIPQKQPFCGCCIAKKHFKLYNLTTTYATLMNLTTIMYLHKVFNLAKDWTVTHRA